MAFTGLISRLGDEIEDPEEETFLLYSQPIPSANLGFVDPKAHSLEINLQDQDVIIQQSPSVLSSNRSGGTTGAVLWKLNVHLASWLSSPSNILFTTPTSSISPPLSRSSSILELGCGISPLNALALQKRVSSVVLTDQIYVQKLLLQNLDENLPSSPPVMSRASSASSSSKSKKRSHRGVSPTGLASGDARNVNAARAEITFRTLDWEKDSVSDLVDSLPDITSFDAVLASDCIYNYALVTPFVQMCIDACRLRRDNSNPCICIVAQQLRNDEVFESWLTEFSAAFRVWRIPDERLPSDLRPSAGFVIHVGILRDG